MVVELIAALDTFILTQTLKCNSQRTIKAYKAFICPFFDWLEGKGINEIHQISESLLIEYHLELESRKCINKQKNLARVTVRTYIRNIRIFLRFCFEKKYIDEPLYKNMIMPRTEKPLIEILSDDDLTKLIGSFDNGILGLRDNAIISLMVDSGLRLSEVSGIRKSDINFIDNYVMVTGKGRKGRIVPIGVSVRQLLIDYQKQREVELEEVFFLTAEGNPLSSDGIRQMIKRLKKRTGMKRLYAHLLRHTFATNFLIDGSGDVYELSRILGHSDIKITENYLHMANSYIIIKNKQRRTHLDNLANKG